MKLKDRLQKAIQRMQIEYVAYIHTDDVPEDVGEVTRKQVGDGFYAYFYLDDILVIASDAGKKGHPVLVPVVSQKRTLKMFDRIFKEC